MNRREFIKGVFGSAVLAVVPLPVKKTYQWLHISEQATWDGKEFRCNPERTIILKAKQMGMTTLQQKYLYAYYNNFASPSDHGLDLQIKPPDGVFGHGGPFWR